MKISKKDAARFLLTYQNLYPPRKLKGKEDIVKYIKKVGCIQYDPLDMVGSNPNLVLQSRVEGFKGGLLNELLYEDRKLLDGWDKNMAIYVAEDWPYFSRYHQESYTKYNKNKSLKKILPSVRDEINNRGPLSSIDLKYDKRVDWAWAPARASRAALESMFYWGELIVHHRAGTRKYYDFAHKNISREIYIAQDPNTTLQDYFKWSVKRRIGAVGMLWNRPGDAWLGVHWMRSKERNLAFEALLKTGEIHEIEVAGLKHPLYINNQDMEMLESILRERYDNREAAFIAPLDNLIWDRKLIEEVFDFQYTWEVYKPVGERKYGYYVLPVVYGNEFVGRFEPKYNKKTKKLDILNWWWEENVTLTTEMKSAIISCFKDFIDYLGATDMDISSNETAQKLKWL